MFAPVEPQQLEPKLIDIQKLPCKFELEVPGLGFLEGNPGENVRFCDELQIMTNSSGITDQDRNTGRLAVMAR